MDIETLLEAFQDFEKKGKRETSPIPEQFLCHVAKTGQTLISWSHFKMYFMFKLEKVIEDFHNSTPEQRGVHNPNIEHVPFEEMKERILKIVDSYNGIPFTIQRLCELLTDPKRNYTGIDKFLRGLEKNVMVVSCVYPTSEKHGASSGNRMNGVMFPGNSTQCSDRLSPGHKLPVPLSPCSQKLNGPESPKRFTRPKLSLSAKLCSNGLLDCLPSKDSEAGESHISSLSPRDESEGIQNSGTKNKHPEEEEEEEEDDSRQEVKRRRFQEKEDVQTTSREETKSAVEKSKNPMETSNIWSGQEKEQDVLPDVSDNQEPSSTQAEPSEEGGDAHDAGAPKSENSESTAEQPEPPTSSEGRSNLEEDEVNNNCTDTQPSSTSPDPSTEGSADGSKREEPVEHD